MFKQLEIEDDCSDISNLEQTNVHGKHASNQSCKQSDQTVNSKVLSEKHDLNHKREVLWEEESGRMIYNYKNKALNMGNLKATDYKHNKQLHMPDPESSDIETLHQFRRTECKRIFDRAQKSVAKIKQVSKSACCS